MAEGGLKDFQESLTCSLCAELYVNPRILPCQHVFCSDCLEKHLEVWTKENQINCPLCCADTQVPKNGLEGFPKAFYYASQVEIFRTLGAQFSVAAAAPSPRLKQPEPVGDTDCKLHKLAVTEFCETCTQLICKSCSALPHKTHTKVAIESAVVQHKSYLQTATSRLENSLGEGGVQQLQQAATQARKQKEEGLLKLQKQTEDLHKAIASHCQQLSCEINTTFNKANTEFQDLIRKRKMEEVHAQECLQRLHEWLNQGTDVEIIKASLEDKKNIEGTIKHLAQTQKQLVPSFNVQVDCRPLSYFGVELVADVKCRFQTETPKCNTSKTLVARKIKQFKLPFQPAGITCTADGNVIVCESAGAIVSTYSPDGQKLFDLQTPSGTKAWDVECTITNIYITDRNTESVLVFTNDGAFVTKLNIDNVEGISGISKVSNYTPMYITGYSSSTLHEVVFSQADNLASQKLFAKSIKLHAPYFVCARNKYVAISNHYDHSVHVTDLQGNLHYSFGTPGQAGAGPNQLNFPNGVVFDSENRLLIASRVGNRITLLTDTGSYLGQIDLEKDNVKTLGITLDDNGHLLVASASTVTTYQYSFQ